MALKINDATFYTAQEVADGLGVTTATIRNYIGRGNLKGQKVMGRWLFTEEAVQQFWKSLKK